MRTSELAINTPIVFESDGYANRFGKTKITGHVKAVNDDGTFDVVLYGMAGPGDEYLLRSVPRHCLTLA